MRYHGSPAPAGFTLIELMIGLALVAILLTVAAPSFREAAMNVRISGQANDLFTDLAYARSEAAKRNVPVLVCPSVTGSACAGTDWTQGWMVFADDNRNGRWDTDEPALKSRGALEGSNTLVSVGHTSNNSVSYIPFQPTGVSTTTGVEFVLCDTRTTPNTGREIEINLTGRPVVLRTTCPKVPALPAS